MRLAAGRKAISDYKKANGDLRGLLTLMVFYVQCGNDFTLKFGDIDETFYDSQCSMVEGIKDRLLNEQDEALAAEFLPRLCLSTLKPNKFLLDASCECNRAKQLKRRSCASKLNPSGTKTLTVSLDELSCPSKQLVG